MDSTQLKDIRDIPVFAFEPELWHWLTFIALSALSFFVLRAIKNKLSRPSPVESLNSAIISVETILRKLSPEADLRSMLFLCGSTIKRFLSLCSGKPVDSFSTSEMQNLSSHSPKPLQTALLALVELEEYKFAPQVGYERSRDLVLKQLDALRSFAGEDPAT